MHDTITKGQLRAYFETRLKEEKDKLTDLERRRAIRERGVSHTRVCIARGRVDAFETIIEDIKNS